MYGDRYSIQTFQPAAAPQGKRQKAKTKRQKSRMRWIVLNLVGLATALIIFTFCLLPFALRPAVGGFDCEMQTSGLN
jgi:hypothetical protein